MDLKKMFFPLLLLLLFFHSVNAAPVEEQEFLLPLVLISGFLDGIHPCGFAVLLFFIAFLFTLRKTRQQIFKTGMTFIFGVFLAYFLIGIGLLRIFFVFPPHFMARVGAVLLILIGLVNVKDFFFYGKWISLKIPSSQTLNIKQWIYKSTIPAAFVAGFIVGLCAFPCAGGIYVAILGLLAAKTTYLEGLAYLVLYNLMFVMPLILTLLLASNKKVVEKMEKFEQAEKKRWRLLTGLIMIGLGLFILYGGIL